MKSSLDNLRDILSGAGTHQDVECVSQELNNPTSAISQFFAGAKIVAEHPFAFDWSAIAKAAEELDKEESDSPHPLPFIPPQTSLEAKPQNQDASSKPDLEQLLAFLTGANNDRKKANENKTPASPHVVFILFAHPHSRKQVGYRQMNAEENLRAHPGVPDVWNLTTEEGSPKISLPTEVAQRCYGTTNQSVQLTLHCVAKVNGYEPQLEVSPPPTQNSLSFVFRFANQERRTLFVSAPRGKRSSAFSQACDLLPADAFRGAGWKLDVESLE